MRLGAEQGMELIGQRMYGIASHTSGSVLDINYMPDEVEVVTVLSLRTFFLYFIECCLVQRHEELIPIKNPHRTCLGARMVSG